MHNLIRLFTHEDDNTHLPAGEAQRRSQLRLRLREQAISLFSIPASYRLTIDEYKEPKAGQEAQVTFVWIKPGSEDGIAVELAEDGLLLDYSRDVDKESETEEVRLEAYLHEEEEQGNPPAQKSGASGVSGAHAAGKYQMKAEQFVRLHRPDALARFALLSSRPTREGWSFLYGQQAMGLPLPRTGFRVHLHRSGEVCGFTYYGEQPEPVLPARIAAPDQVRRMIDDTLELELKLCQIGSYYTAQEYGLRLVYEPLQVPRSFPADETELLKEGEARQVKGHAGNGEEQDPEELEELWLSVPQRALTGKTLAYTDERIAAWTGIDPSCYVKLREADMGDRLGMVWRRSDWTAETMGPLRADGGHTETAADGVAEAGKAEEPGKADAGYAELTASAFMRERSESTIKVQVEPATGRLLSLMRFEERSGPLRLTRPECLQLALDLLADIHPGMEPYLQLQEQEENPDSDTEAFSFRIIHRGIALTMEHIRVVVNRTTGLIDHLMSPNLRPEELAAVPSAPAITADQARRIYLEETELLLEWKPDYASDTVPRPYKLFYSLIQRGSGDDIRWIDAMNGARIGSRRLT
ncbi:YcdB/YcdC domain-containing protein [Paenibacillus puerhi]|uniref:YcdB/YcdC domain-containing protein n=1 Tax=Paenibacillus puerhi TaxID=2692622 RepID=UPI00135680C6|nr:YcdB/YcdC domain-containing protein [Paenibacillus puerhi]